MWIIENNQLTAKENMAIDELILQSIDKTNFVLRFYQWSPPGLSIGRFQDINRSVNFEECEKYGIDVVKRLSGGRAVLHMDELTYSVSVSKNSCFWKDSLLESYEQICNALIKGLNNFGISDCRLKPFREKGSYAKGSLVCFDSPSFQELVWNNRKLIGSAQHRTKKGFIQHGSIKLKPENKLIFKLLNQPDTLSDVLFEKTACLEEICGKIDVNDLIESLVRGFLDVFPHKEIHKIERIEDAF